VTDKDITLKHKNHYTAADISAARSCVLFVFSDSQTKQVLLTSTLLNDWSLHWGYNVLGAAGMGY
jgi:hypothetical protein